MDSGDSLALLLLPVLLSSLGVDGGVVRPEPPLPYSPAASTTPASSNDPHP